jgi:hypothetical protein
VIYKQEYCQSERLLAACLRGRNNKMSIPKKKVKQSATGFYFLSLSLCVDGGFNGLLLLPEFCRFMIGGLCIQSLTKSG